MDKEQEAYIAETIAIAVFAAAVIGGVFLIGGGPYLQMIVESWQNVMEIFMPWR